MNLVQLDAAIRIGAVTTILLFAALLLRSPRPIGLPAILFAPLAICLSGFVIGNTPAPQLRPTGILGSAAHDVSGFTVVYLWWFSLSCFDRQFRLEGGVLGIGLMWTAVAALDRGLLGDTFAQIGLSRLLVVLGFGIVGHLVWRLIAERSGDLIQRRHDARIMAAVVLGGMLFIDLAADAVFGFAWRPLAFAMTQNAMILAFGLWLSANLLAVRADMLTTIQKSEDTPSMRTRPDEARRDDVLHGRLTALMETQRVFLDSDLTFAMFVARMGTSERRVRKLINHDLGHDHFRTFLNHYRMKEARRLLADPRRTDDKLIAIALDSGFASLASFNRVFLSSAGCSPGQYRRAALNDSLKDIHTIDFGAAAIF